jgi:hypothetical protein
MQVVRLCTPHIGVVACDSRREYPPGRIEAHAWVSDHIGIGVRNSTQRKGMISLELTRSQRSLDYHHSEELDDYC